MSVQRTTIVMPIRLKRMAMEASRKRGTSFAEFVRKAVENELAASASAARQGEGDPLLDDTAVYRGRAPRNLARDHDKHLYGE